MSRAISLGLAVMVSLAVHAGAQAPRSGNPILSGWYADPEARVFEHEYWIYPTYSAPYGEQTLLDAFSSPDLVTWTKHPRVLDTTRVPWATRAVWAPSIVEKDRSYYLFFGANDIQNDSQVGGIGVARASHPGGPFTDHLGKPLVDKFHNGAQPIDPFVFKDVDGTYYLIYGGWRHCNIARLNADFTGFVPFPDGTTFKEITPAGYVEGSFMFVRDGKYYFMWSEGGWTGPELRGRVRDRRVADRTVRARRQDPAAGSGGGDRRGPPFGAPRARIAHLVHRLSPPSARRDGSQPPRRLHRRDDVRRERRDPAGRHHERRRGA